jgi:hypothetical protein
MSQSDIREYILVYSDIGLYQSNPILKLFFYFKYIHARVHFPVPVHFCVHVRVHVVYILHVMKMDMDMDKNINTNIEGHGRGQGQGQGMDIFEIQFFLYHIALTKSEIGID